MQTYDRPTPETESFMLRIDDSEIDLGQVEAKLKTLECERDYARELLMRGLKDFGWMDGPEDWPDLMREIEAAVSGNVQAVPSEP